MKRPDPYGLWKLANDFMIAYEDRLFDMLVELGVLENGMLAPWYSVEDIIYPGDPDFGRPRLPFGEVYEDEAPPAATGPLVRVGPGRVLDLE